MVAGDRPATLQPQDDFPTNRGGLCSKGWTAADLLDHRDRLLTPLVREIAGDRTSALRPAGWDEALDRVASGIAATQQRYGNDGVGVFGGGGLTNEKAYTLGKFARVALKTSAIDYNGRFCMSSSATAGNRAFGVDRGLPFPLSDIADAAAILLVGANPADTMPPAMQYFDQGRAAGARHIVVDPRRTSTAEGASMHLAPLPGTDLALANGLLHIAIRDGLLDETYIAERTTGFDAVRAAVASYWPDWVERITGIGVEQLRETVRILASAPSAMILTARGAEQHSNGTDTAQAFINLALALGLPGKWASGYGTITGQGNGQGGREHGQKADQLPGLPPAGRPGGPRRTWRRSGGSTRTSFPCRASRRSRCSTGSGTDGGVRALLVLASNIVVSAPDANRVRDRLERAGPAGGLRHLPVRDRGARRRRAADRPVGGGGRHHDQRRGPGDPPQAGAAAAGRGAGRPADADRSWPANSAAGSTSRTIRGWSSTSCGGPAPAGSPTTPASPTSGSTPEKGVFWPCPADDHPGTPRMFAERFADPGRPGQVPSGCCTARRPRPRTPSTRTC